MKKISSVLFLVFFVMASKVLAFDHNHTLWDELMKDTRVLSFQGKQSLVNYAYLKKNPQKLNQYVKELTTLTKDTYNTFNKDQKLAFLINAYNALTVKLIVDHYPVKTIKDLGGFFSTPWKKRFFTLFGKKHHLDNIEHDLIREEDKKISEKTFNEPRIHFAVVCASISCPTLQNFAFKAKDKKGKLKTLNDQLQYSMDFFLRDKSKNQYFPKKNELKVSKIFKWYKGDFKKGFSSEKSYLLKYYDPKLTSTEKDVIKMKYLHYDWNLNDLK